MKRPLQRIKLLLMNFIFLLFKFLSLLGILSLWYTCNVVPLLTLIDVTNCKIYCNVKSVKVNNCEVVEQKQFLHLNEKLCLSIFLRIGLNSNKVDR